MLNQNVEVALIPCAGLGTRMFPITKVFPKEMLPLNCKPAIQFTIQYCVDVGIKEVILVVSQPKALIKSFLDENFGDKIKITYVNQEVMNGTANCVLLCKEALAGRNFLFINGDCIAYSNEIYKSLLEKFDGISMIHVHNVKDDEKNKFGIFEVDSDEIFITKVLEKPLPTETTSRYGGYIALIATPDVFNYFHLLKPNAKGELVFTEVFDFLAAEKKLKCLINSNILFVDTGDKLAYAKGNLIFTEKNY
jgi:UTP--glucose-1-phosphate uridylyltransferase